MPRAWARAASEARRSLPHTSSSKEVDRARRALLRVIGAVDGIGVALVWLIRLRLPLASTLTCGSRAASTWRSRASASSMRSAAMRASGLVARAWATRPSSWLSPNSDHQLSATVGAAASGPAVL